ncbi:MTRF1L release factor glutamine methyltransferase isoform X1 [Stegostoma tigrinum]|uniref:MTRF1L release factor glutamine methyltransferase isoform X1 n=1 Tax=Stegostoma tigrinum TaxID=3053191 RepID=UPI0028705574|nr:MTRF1L release factor glutamine methyltransferase isoform X1 [Stegostoma tigrinum]
MWWKVFSACCVYLAPRFRVNSHYHYRSEDAGFLGAVTFLNALSRNPCRLIHDKMTGINCVTHWKKIFEEKGISEPQQSSEYIISHVLGAKTIHNLTEEALSRPLTTEQKQMIWNLCSKRLHHMPVQYVIEEWDFCDLTLKIKPPVFIPRPETEELVSLVVSELAEEEDILFSVENAHWQNSHRAARPLFLEVGCGSGAIVLSLLHFFKQSYAVAVDKSTEAVNLTRQNAERLCMQHRLQALQLNVISDSQKLTRICGSVDVIVSNPPYVFHEDMFGLMPEILRYEDCDALDGGADGLKIIKAILQLAPTVLKNRGKVFLEVDPRHPEMIQNWLQTCTGLQLTYRATHRDICGKLRFCELQRS